MVRRAGPSLVRALAVSAIGALALLTSATAASFPAGAATGHGGAAHRGTSGPAADAVALGGRGKHAHDQSTVEHPMKGLARVALDYAAPLSFSGGVVLLPPLERAVVRAALEDFAYLKYSQRNDLGGFKSAPVGRWLTALTGRSITKAPKRSQIPLLTKLAGQGKVFGYQAGTVIPSTSAPVPPQTVPSGPHTTPKTPVAPPHRSTKTTPKTAFRTPPTTPHAPPATSAPTTSVPAAPPSTPTTVPPTTSTSTSTTAPPPTTSTTAPPPTTSTTSPSPSPPATSPTQYFELTETRGHFPVIDVTNMEPGGSATEYLTLENIGSQPFDLWMRSIGTSSNPLSSTLRLVVKGFGSGHIYYDGPLSSSPTEIEIAQLAPDQTVLLQVTLSLPSAAGNSVQHETAKVDLYWDATA